MDDLGVNGISFRVHHFARQQSAPMPLLAAIAARTSRIELGTGVIDMRYENPLMLAEEAASVDLISGNRLALGVSRGHPKRWCAATRRSATPVRRTRAVPTSPATTSTCSSAPSTAKASPNATPEPLRRRHRAAADRTALPGLRTRIWWGAGTTATAEWAGRIGVNLMSSTLLTEADGTPFDILQARQLDAFRAAWREAGHPGEPRTSVSRSIFPIVSDEDHLYFGGSAGSDQIGVIDACDPPSARRTLLKPDVLVEQLQNDAAVMSADTLLLTIPSQMGVEFNLRLVENFATHVAPALGWESTLATA